MHTTNYFNTFIEIAEDSHTSIPEVPPLKGGNKTAANLQFEMVIDHPYKYTSDDVLFHVFAVKNNISKGDLKAEREKFFSKGQPCLRASPLTKRYGWGVHANEAGKIALYGVDSDEYKKLAKDKTLQHVKAMRSKRK
ncbi:MAG TPA: DUF6157 family protein [Chitinophaga sp.]|uniref:DUF6157 family protein n=1 Tax=Chitinophaga sp. TaxID=1869181 RepID=UPI002DB96B20|nr:DUF6157 family protein [Chitinophaga sp.]HEU4553951.1 DUF6157 family protein [Chitinophaga sp.]